MSKLEWRLLTRKRGSSTSQGIPPGKEHLAWVGSTVTLLYGHRDALPRFPIGVHDLAVNTRVLCQGDRGKRETNDKRCAGTNNSFHLVISSINIKCELTLTIPYIIAQLVPDRR